MCNQNGFKTQKSVIFLGGNNDNYFRMYTDQITAGIRQEAFKAYISELKTKLKTNNDELISLDVQMKDLELDLYQTDEKQKSAFC